MSNVYGNHTPIPPEKRSQMAKDAAKTRRFLHPTKDDIALGAQYLSSLSEVERDRIYKHREYGVTMFSIICGMCFLSVPLLFIVLLFG